MKNDFDKVAGVYDPLARLVFGSKLDDAQQFFLNGLEKKANVLILGGGTGRILEWLPKQKELDVTFVELSHSMLEKAKKRDSNAKSTSFIHKNGLATSGQFNYVITNFFFDCFSQEQLDEMIKHVVSMLDVEGKLFVTDFKDNDRLKDQWINRLMHWFFKLITNLESKALKDISNTIEAHGLVRTAYKSFDRGQIFSAIYERP